MPSAILDVVAQNRALRLLSRYVGLIPNPVSEGTRQAHARTQGASVTTSVCPYCAVGCSQLVYVKNGRFIDIEGNYEIPIIGGTHSIKGVATFQLLSN